MTEVALVTGGNKGIGRAIVRQLGERGFTVYLGARDPSAVGELPAGLDIRVVPLDVTDSDTVAAAVGLIEGGRLDVLVNNAGVMVEWGVEATAEVFRATYEVNVFGVVTVTSACLPLLRRSDNPRIVNVSSGLGSLTVLKERPGFLAYSSSKAALNAMTLIYANALRAEGIKVNAVSPGLVPTDQNAAAPFPRGDRTTADGAVTPVALATIPVDGPTGVFLGPDGDVIPW
jgi:NAD(P)-dependent dehydrogenase (short-subunit alcohol dehydrogenase family)